MRARFKDQRARITRLRAFIRDMHANGIPRQQIAAAVQRTPQVVSYHARIMGISFQKERHDA